MKFVNINSVKCRGTLRGHVDSVNSVTWKTCSSILCTSSSDKTVSLWDARTSLCVQTFYGHQASCSHAIFNPKVSYSKLNIVSKRNQIRNESFAEHILRGKT